MTESSASVSTVATDTTPTGIQSIAELAARRRVVLCLNVVTYLALCAAAASVLGAGGWTAIDVVLMLCFVVAAPWTVLGFWNSVIGLWLLHGVKDGFERVAPYAAAGDTDAALTERTAVLMTLRNEDPARAFARLRVVKDSVDATGQGEAFGWFVLSDTTDPAVAAAEEAAFAAWRATTSGADRLHYRRRELNTGFKAGNVKDFCERWGADYAFMLPLDADSLMSGASVVRMARIMQAHPRLGILQSLVVGAPTESGFARLFQFGMRHGMRPYTMGQAWWTADCGPFWGHNAYVRIAPFVTECGLPVIPGGPPFGGHVLSHDQVEATLMRKAGYEVRVLPDEGGSWEDNPPTVLEFSRRDVRWCQGNLQYLKLLDLPGLLPISRFQLVWAILMFIGVPAWTLMIALAALKPFETADLAGGFPAALAVGLYCTFLVMYLAPKLAGFADAALEGTARWGGGLRFAAGALAELLFSFLLGAITTFRIAIFMTGLLFGRTVVWNGQARDAHALSWGTAVKGLWPQTLFGVVVLGLMAWNAPTLALWSLPLTLGFLTAVPFAVLTSSDELGRVLLAARLCAIPEEFDTPAEIAALTAASEWKQAAA